ncbi:hypothetical protein AMAG_16533 [Allomyces macrogynus ATCC 38327]|uniref:ATPase inhibitor, mitochondrial n=1 Tax=Allomyces macrogynus (strain ATCC 38327) TaxID=578462 RepID=A0A0L0TCU7_ALLM3|nr:hypothetical protein GGF31_004093 [Allomyces arbusculus]KNE72490.1 hypothetical protein AMAG_16533 [Allomyces macrogynus ATCC 38327]|eukprot:KNE72490.1 hypothetical protein AMAG_16533 [Allomyces macrogynus ATCC 38327]
MFAATARRTALRMFPARAALYSTESSGAVRSAGGSFAKKEAAQEEMYMRKREAEKLEHLNEELDAKYHPKEGQAAAKDNAKAPKKDE